jgi:hypothetical protein
MNLRVCYIYGAQKRHELLPVIRQFCDDNHILLTAREYDPDHWEEDAFSIKNLPAFHVYYRDGWDDTFYPESNYIGILKRHMAQAQKEFEKTSRWKWIWQALVPSKRRGTHAPVHPTPVSLPLEFPAEHRDSYEVRTTLRTQQANPSR